MSAQHMICDLSTLESMAQRVGRVNRRGEGDAVIDVVYETDPNPKPLSPGFEAARWETKKVLERLPTCVGAEGRRDASPTALGAVMKSLTDPEREAVFAPKPTILPVTDILFDAWALTTIRGSLPGRPEVESYLHGLADWQPPETRVAWREEVGEITGDLRILHSPADLLVDFPLKPHELLREPSDRSFKQLEIMAKRLKDRPAMPVWLLDADGSVDVLTLAELASKDQKERIQDKTVLLPPASGGLSGGMLDGASPNADDVADTEDRKRIWDDSRPKLPKGLRRVRTIQFPGDDEDAVGKVWYWFKLDNEGDTSARAP